MKKILLFLLFMPFIAWAQPNYNAILQPIKQNNIEALSPYWDNIVDLTIGSTDYTYDAKQVKLALEDFLSKNKPTQCSIVHTGTARDNSSYYLIGKLIAGSKTYRIYILFRQKQDKYLIQECRFEYALNG